MTPEGPYQASFALHPIVTRISRIQQKTPRTKSFTLKAPAITLNAVPGQFLMVWIPGTDEIPMSIASVQDDQVEFAVANVGEATARLHALKVGDLLGLRGPLGRGFRFPPRLKSKSLLLVAGGCGSPPIYYAATEAIKRGYTLDIILSASTKADLLYDAEFKKIKSRTYLVATDDGSAGVHGTSVDAVKTRLENNLKYAACFACGPEGMLVSLYELLKSQPIPLQLSLERYMKCGVGICGHCIIDTQGRRVCYEGPVFDAKSLKGTDFGRWTRDSSGKRQASTNTTRYPR